MKLKLNYPKELCIFALYQTPPHLDLACHQARKDPHEKFNKIFIFSKTNVVTLSSHFNHERS